jgi:hypothetical protein
MARMGTKREPMGLRRTRTKASKGPQREPTGARRRVTGAGPYKGLLCKGMREGKREDV